MHTVFIHFQKSTDFKEQINFLNNNVASLCLPTKINHLLKFIIILLWMFSLSFFGNFKQLLKSCNRRFKCSDVSRVVKCFRLKYNLKEIVIFWNNSCKSFLNFYDFVKCSLHIKTNCNFRKLNICFNQSNNYGCFRVELFLNCWKKFIYSLIPKVKVLGHHMCEVIKWITQIKDIISAKYYLNIFSKLMVVLLSHFIFAYFFKILNTSLVKWKH